MLAVHFIYNDIEQLLAMIRSPNSCFSPNLVFSLEWNTAEATTQNVPLVRDNNAVISITQTLKEWQRDIPGDPVVKNPPAKAGDMGSVPGLGGCHMLQRN